MKKLYKSFESESQTFQNKLNYYQEVLQGRFQGMLQKSEEKKKKIIQKLQSAKEQLQISIQKNNPNKASKLQKKIQHLEGEMQKINQKDKIVKDYHQVYDGLIQQLQITQDQKVKTLSSAQRNNNYQILCSIKRQAISLQSQVYKKKHIDPLVEICQHCNDLLNQYLKFGVDIKFQQADILKINIEPDNRLKERHKSQDEMNFIQYEKKQIQSDSQFQSQFNLYDCKNSQRRKGKPNQNEEKKIYYQFQGGQYENKQFIQSQQEEKYSKLWNKKYYEQQKQPYQQHPSDINQQFDTEDKNQEYENINQQKKQQPKTQTVLDDSNLCRICFEFPKQYVATPCGHFVYCLNCKDLALKQCLICREPVQLLIKVFQ